MPSGEPWRLNYHVYLTICRLPTAKEPSLSGTPPRRGVCPNAAICHCKVACFRATDPSWNRGSKPVGKLSLPYFNETPSAQEPQNEQADAGRTGERLGISVVSTLWWRHLYVTCAVEESSLSCRVSNQARRPLDARRCPLARSLSCRVLETAERCC